MIIYLAGKITGNPEYRKQFAAAKRTSQTRRKPTSAHSSSRSRMTDSFRFNGGAHWQ